MTLSLLDRIDKLLDAALPLLPEDQARSLADLREERRRHPGLKLLLYGAYDSGKSTLANALWESSLDVGCVPTTDALQPIERGEYQVIDSPGFGAPDPRVEALSREAARWDADVVVFVLRGGHGVEDELTWREISDLVGRGRPVLVVLNVDSPLDPDEERALRDTIAERTRALAPDSGMARLLGPIVVNADAALRARRDGKQALETASSIRLLEQEIRRTVAHLDAFQGALALAAALQTALHEEAARRRERAPRKVAEHDRLPREALEALDAVEEAFEKEVSAEVEQLRAEMACKTEAHFQSGGAPDKLWEAFGVDCRHTVEELGRLAQHLLHRLLLRQGFATGAEEIRRALADVDEVFAALETEERSPATSLEAPRRDVDKPAPAPAPVSAPAEVRADADSKGLPSIGGAKLTLPVTVVSETLRKQGILRSMTRSGGAAGQAASRFVRIAPAVAMAGDMLMAALNFFAEQERVERLRAEQQWALDQQLEREEAARRAWARQAEALAAQLVRRAREAVLVGGARLFAATRRECRSALEAEEQEQVELKEVLELRDETRLLLRDR